MKRLLILHCGPMKTGSTVIQDALEFNRDKLRQLGVSYYHVRAKALLGDLQRIISEEELSGNRILLLSSEFFCQQDSVRLKNALCSFSGECHAILVSRPLREVYPSLYLQNLKGSMRRTTSFDFFLERQIAVDMMTNISFGGQLMNAPALDARLSNAGFKTHWIRYSRCHLLDSFVEALELITNISLAQLSVAELGKPFGLSPRRSLRMELAALARAINYLNRLNFISAHLRERLLIFLLIVSECMNHWFGFVSPLRQSQLDRCNEVDRLVNQAFLSQFWDCSDENEK